MMHLVFANTSSHNRLRDEVFIPSLKDEWNLVNFEFPFGGNGHYGTPGWFRIVVERFTRCAEFVRSHTGDIAVFSDVDIQFIKPCQELIKKQLVNSDVCYQRDMFGKRVINTGFVCARCSDIVADYFEYLGRGNEVYTDQEQTNVLASFNMLPFRWSFLPDTFATELSWGHQKLSELSLYHSTLSITKKGESGSVDSKIRQHCEMRNRIAKINAGKTQK